MNEIDSGELKALVQRIVSSGELGRSKTYASILEYLLECSLNGTTPKEIAIAIDVLGRDTDFDVAKDSIVRVHIYHLRNKLQAYFEKHGDKEKIRIDIPKGQYLITTSVNEPAVQSSNKSITGKELSRKPLSPWIMALAIVLLFANLTAKFYPNNELPIDITSNQISSAPKLWQAIFDDQNPVLIVIGDYYIMGELNEQGDVTRMVREFAINSAEDLESAQSQAVSVSQSEQNYINLDLSYIPTSTSFALLQIMKVLGNDSERVSIKMMSNLSTADLAENHIIYLGYLSGLDSLEDLLFASSNLYVGSTYDELLHIDTNEVFTSSSGLSVGENSYQDYGLLSTFHAPNDHQFILVAGMRDEGLINLSQEVSDFESLKRLEESIVEVGDNALSSDSAAYEALFHVTGFDGTNFDANLVYSSALNTEVIWEARLIGNQER